MAYEEELLIRLGADDKILRNIASKAKSAPKRVVFAEADNYKILKAAKIVKDEGIAIPILLGNEDTIRKIISEHGIEFENIEIIDPWKGTADTEAFAQHLFSRRQRRGITMYEARKFIRDRNYYGASMVEFGQADALISGLTKNYKSTLKPALQVIGTKPGVKKIAGMYMMLTKKGPVFLGDTTVNPDPSLLQT